MRAISPGEVLSCRGTNFEHAINPDNKTVELLNRITITCFAASYAVILGLEVTRLFFRAPVRLAVMLVFGVAGLFAHTTYLVLQAKLDLDSGAPLSNWHAWCLLAAWVVVVVYLGSLIRQPQTMGGLFFLPVVLSLIAAGYLVRDHQPFSTDSAKSLWNLIHGASLLLGTVTVSLGFVAGTMYLIQAYRLKHKMGSSSRLRLPSLEWLQKINERALVCSSGFLGIGLLSGIVLNLINQGSGATSIKWTDPVVWTSAALFLWLASATIFNAIYKPARHGRKVAYLVVVSFLFLALELFVVFAVEHASHTELTQSLNPPVGWEATL